jgi:hypothetical protein
MHKKFHQLHVKPLRNYVTNIKSTALPNAPEGAYTIKSDYVADVGEIPSKMLC